MAKRNRFVDSKECLLTDIKSISARGGISPSGPISRRRRVCFFKIRLMKSQGPWNQILSLILL